MSRWHNLRSALRSSSGGVVGGVVGGVGVDPSHSLSMSSSASASGGSGGIATSGSVALSFLLKTSIMSSSRFKKGGGGGDSETSSKLGPSALDAYVQDCLKAKSSVTDATTTLAFTRMYDELLTWEQIHLPAEGPTTPNQEALGVDDDVPTPTPTTARERAFWRAARQALRSCLLAPAAEWKSRVAATQRWFKKSKPTPAANSATPLGAALFANTPTPGAVSLAPSVSQISVGTITASPSAASLERCASRLLHSETKRRTFVTPYSGTRAAPVTKSSASKLRTPAYHFLPASTWKPPPEETPQQAAARAARIRAPQETPELHGGLTPRDWKGNVAPPKSPQRSRPPLAAPPPKPEPAQRVRTLTPAEAARASWLRERWVELRNGEAAVASYVDNAMEEYGERKALADEQSLMRAEAGWLARSEARRRVGMPEPACTQQRSRFGNEEDPMSPGTTFGASMSSDGVGAGGALSVYWTPSVDETALTPNPKVRAHRLMQAANPMSQSRSESELLSRLPPPGQAHRSEVLSVDDIMRASAKKSAKKAGGKGGSPKKGKTPKKK